MHILGIALVAFLLALLGPVGSQAGAEEREFRLGIQHELVESGLVKFVLPRFSLKTGIRIEIVDLDSPASANLHSQGQGRLVFTGLGADWRLEQIEGQGGPAVERFAGWLAGDVGQKTIDAFRKDGEQIFFAAADAEAEVEAAAISGDVIAGEKLSVLHCGRCHQVNDATRYSTIGSTPSFALMRGFKDWSVRFEAFFALNPHPSFTIVDGVTEPFGRSNPPPIEPVVLTIDEIDAILAYVATIEPANLGSPLQLK